MKENEMQKFATAEVVADMLGLSKQGLYEAVRKGLVPAVRIGRRIRFNLDLLASWAASGGRSVEGKF